MDPAPFSAARDFGYAVHGGAFAKGRRELGRCARVGGNS